MLVDALLRQDPLYVKVPIKLADESCGEQMLPIHLPYDIFQHLINKCSLKIGNDLTDNYWKHLEAVGDKWACSTTEFRRAHELNGHKVWPLGFYGDEAVLGL